MNVIDLLKQLFLAVGAAIMTAELENDAPGSGVQKKQQAMAIVRDLLRPHLPDWAEPIAWAAASMLMDALVKWWNRQGFSASFATVPEPGRPTA